MARRPMVGRYDQNQSDYANHESKLYFWSHYELNPLIYWWLGTDCDDYEDLLFWDCGHCCCSWWWWDKWDNTRHCISLSVNGRLLHQEILTSRSITFNILGHLGDFKFKIYQFQFLRSFGNFNFKIYQFHNFRLQGDFIFFHYSRSSGDFIFKI